MSPVKMVPREPPVNILYFPFRIALEEMIEFEAAIEAASKFVDLAETLLIVTADHSHSVGLVGQPSREKSIFTLEPVYAAKVRFPINYLIAPNILSMDN